MPHPLDDLGDDELEKYLEERKARKAGGGKRHRVHVLELDDEDFAKFFGGGSSSSSGKADDDDDDKGGDDKGDKGDGGKPKRRGYFG